MTLAAAQRPLGHSAGFVAEIERWMEVMGLGLQQVSVVGYRFTADGDIFDAVDLASARTLLTFDSRAAKARVEALPWVERASIERVLPDRIEVRVSERAASAVWTLGARHYLIDKTGRVLSAVPASGIPALPRIAGEGAAREAPALFAMLGGRPELARDVELAERIGGRRWRLQLAGGSIIDLPADGADQALAGAAGIRAALRGRAKVVDMRVAGRTLVREGERERPAEPGSIDALLAGGF